MAVAARINHGRWIVDCPACPNAHLLPVDGNEFRCANCGSGPHDVNVPADRHDIEEALEPRDVLNRNWQPGETVADLHAANVEHGVA